MSKEKNTLLIVIPALDEQETIEAIIKACLDARIKIIKHSPIEDVKITVVSDGSTDLTVERANKYKDRINLIVFEKNRGYGAAIKAGWKKSDAGLLSFIDADGTCDPNYFADLGKALYEADADIALGNRMSKGSKMPFVRKVGNTFFAFLMSVLALRRIHDISSGMRIVRAKSAKRLMPLPDDLHFTPAMSSKAILAKGMRIVEVDMLYSERGGSSKLSAIRHGGLFLKEILTQAFIGRPHILLGYVLMILLVAAALTGKI